MIGPDRPVAVWPPRGTVTSGVARIKTFGCGSVSNIDRVPAMNSSIASTPRFGSATRIVARSTPRAVDRFWSRAWTNSIRGTSTAPDSSVFGEDLVHLSAGVPELVGVERDHPVGTLLARLMQHSGDRLALVERAGIVGPVDRQLARESLEHRPSLVGRAVVHHDDPIARGLKVMNDVETQNVDFVARHQHAENGRPAGAAELTDAGACRCRGASLRR